MNLHNNIPISPGNKLMSSLKIGPPFLPPPVLSMMMAPSLPNPLLIPFGFLVTSHLHLQQPLRGRPFLLFRGRMRTLLSHLYQQILPHWLDPAGIHLTTMKTVSVKGFLPTLLHPIIYILQQALMLIYTLPSLQCKTLTPCILLQTFPS